MTKNAYCEIKDVDNLKPLGNEDTGTFKGRKQLGYKIVENDLCFLQNPKFSDMEVFPKSELGKKVRNSFNIQFDKIGQNMNEMHCNQLNHSLYQVGTDSKGIHSYRKLSLGNHHEFFRGLPKMSKKDAEKYDKQCSALE